MNEQLTSDELRQVLAEWIRPMYPKERQKIAGLFEAVIARAETAEADNRRLTARVAELEAALVGMDGHMTRLISERNDALDRADALEAQLAAQQWRPGNAEPPAHGWYWVYDFDEDDAPTRRFYGPQGWGMHGDEAAPDWHMAIAPLPQEPTP